MKTRLFFLMLDLAVCGFAQQGFSIVVQKDNPAKSISKSLLRRMMMGESPSWAGGTRVVVLMGPSGDAPRTAALRQICSMGESEFAKLTLQTSFEGGARAVPKTLPSTASVRQVVQLTPGAVGIVDVAEPGPGLKILPVE